MIVIIMDIIAILGGTEKHFCKFNDAILEAIRNDLINTDMTLEQLHLKHNASIGFISDFNNGKIWRQDGVQYPLRQPKEKVRYYCADCGAELYQDTKAIRCHTCAMKLTRRVERPSREQLKVLIRTIPFTQIGQQFGVSDNAIKKWCDVYSLPRKKKDICQYSDEEWANI